MLLVWSGVEVLGLGLQRPAVVVAAGRLRLVAWRFLAMLALARGHQQGYWLQKRFHRPELTLVELTRSHQPVPELTQLALAT